MLFVVEYELGWETLEAAIAKRLDWEEVQPDDFHFVGEYVWPDRESPFRGIAIVEVASVEALNAFVLHYGPTTRMRCSPASDVKAAIAGFQGARR